MKFPAYHSTTETAQVTIAPASVRDLIGRGGGIQRVARLTGYKIEDLLQASVRGALPPLSNALIQIPPSRQGASNNPHVQSKTPRHRLPKWLTRSPYSLRFPVVGRDVTVRDFVGFVNPLKRKPATEDEWNHFMNAVWPLSISGINPEVDMSDREAVWEDLAYGPEIRGEGDTDLNCGECDHVIIHAIDPDQYVSHHLVHECRACGAHNYFESIPRLRAFALALLAQPLELASPAAIEAIREAALAAQHARDPAAAFSSAIVQQDLGWLDTSSVPANPTLASPYLALIATLLLMWAHVRDSGNAPMRELAIHLNKA